MVIRGVMLFCSRPILRFLHEDKTPVSIEDAAVMTWGGLRGAVGLALAIVVSHDKGKKVASNGDPLATTTYAISDDDAHRVLFYTGGIAMLTMVLNAVTCPMLVKYLGITKTPLAKLRLLLDIHRQLVETTKADKHPASVRRIVNALLDEIQDHLKQRHKDGNTQLQRHDSVQQEAFERAVTARSSLGSSVTSKEVKRLDRADRQGQIRASRRQESQFKMSKENSTLIDEYDQYVRWVAGLSQDQLGLLGKLPKGVMDTPETEQALKDCLYVDGTPQMVAAVNEVYLSLVKFEYWKMIDRGEFILGTGEAKALLNSIAVGLHTPAVGLRDLQFLEQSMHFSRSLQEEDADEEVAEEIDFFLHANITAGTERLWKDIRASNKEAKEAWKAGARAFASFLTHTFMFNFLVVTTIVLNLVFMLVWSTEDSVTRNRDQHVIMEVLFAVMFTLECIVKIIAQRTQYFCNTWDQFDFVLVLLSIMGAVFEIIGNKSLTTQARILRMNRVLRALRLLRCVRLFRLCWMITARMFRKEDVSILLAEHVAKLTVLKSFIRGHLSAQVQFIKFLGLKGTVHRVEEARCIIESQTNVYKAILMAMHETKFTDKCVLRGMNYLTESMYATEELIQFVNDAHRVGVVSGREADSILHPLEDHEKKIHKIFTDEHFGVRRSVIESIGRTQEDPDAKVSEATMVGKPILSKD